MTPIIILCGRAGSGKDTVGQHIADHYNGVCIGQADPIKRMAKVLLGFSSEQLWGPSGYRNKIDCRLNREESGGLNDLMRSVGSKLLENGTTGSAAYWAEAFFRPENRKRAGNLLLNWWYDISRNYKGGVSPRVILQTLGTEWGREVENNVWSRLAVETCNHVLVEGVAYSSEHGYLKEKTDYNLAVITDGRFRNEVMSVRAAGGVTVKVERTSGSSISGGVTNHRSESELDGLPNHFFDYVIKNDGSKESLYNKTDYMIQDILKGPKVL